MRLPLRATALALLLVAPAFAQPVETERGVPHAVEVSPGDALLVRLANLGYGAGSDGVEVAIRAPDGTTLDDASSSGVSLFLTAEATRYLPEAAPGTWTVTFLGEPSQVPEALTVEFLAAPSLPFSLHEAARFGDLDALRVALDADGGDLDAWDGVYRTPLMVAAAAGHTEAARMLLDAGADPDAVAGTPGASYEMTMTLERPLHLAAGEDHGADVDAQDAFGSTPLVAAVYGASVSSVRRLIDAGADVHIEGEEGAAPELARELAEAEWTDDALRPALRIIASTLGAME